jgi:hypothetical protein
VRENGQASHDDILYSFLKFKYAQASLPSPEDSRLVSRERLSLYTLSKHIETYQKPDEDIKKM